MALSQRAADGGQPNDLATLAHRLRAAGVQVTDLTDSNPTRHALSDPAVFEAVARASRSSLRYDPDPRGPRTAREALAERFGGGPDDYWLTASTSEAYSWLFHLLADPGDAVAIPAPGYPLLEPLALLAGVATRPYGWFHLHPHGWSLDTAQLAQVATTPGLRAVVAVNPNNPTGAYVDAAARDELVAACDRAGAALIADEVFGPFALDLGHVSLAPPGCATPGGPSAALSGTPRSVPASGRPSAWQPIAPGACSPSDARGRPARAGDPTSLSLGGEDRVVTFALDGLSKLLAAPQLKLGWIRLSGPARKRAVIGPALDRIADTFLSVGTPVALALPELLGLADGAVARTRARLAANLATARSVFAGDAWRVRRCDGGWSVLVDVPRSAADDGLALRLLRDHHLAVHPGWFYDAPDLGLLALSLLPEPDVFRANCLRLRDAVMAQV